MYTGEIYAKITQMRDAATALNQCSAEINRCIDSVEGEVRALSSDRFMSVGAEMFRAEYYKLTPRLKEAFDLLADFQAKLNASADDIELAARSMGGNSA
jgi:uncharacterized protein YukE